MNIESTSQFPPLNQDFSIYNDNSRSHQPPQSPLTNLNMDSNNESSHQKTQLRIEILKWHITIAKTSRLNTYTNKKKSTRQLNYDRTITPKRKFTTPIKTKPQSTKQDTLKSFGFREEKNHNCHWTTPLKLTLMLWKPSQQQINPEETD